MFIRAFLAAPIQHARHPAQPLWSSLACPPCQQHSWVLHSPTGTRSQGSSITPWPCSDLTRSSAVKFQQALAPVGMLSPTVCWWEWGWPQTLCCHLPPAQCSWLPENKFVWGHWGWHPGACSCWCGHHCRGLWHQCWSPGDPEAPWA